MEELLLRRFLPREELDVVDEEDVGGAVAVLELERRGVLDRVDHLVHELLGRDEEDPLAGSLLTDVVPDGVHEMRLAEPDAAVEEERVVARAGALRHRLADGVRELIPASDDEGVERVLRTQVRFLARDRTGPGTHVFFGRLRLGANLKRHSHRLPCGGRERRFNERAVVLVQPVDVERTRYFQKERPAVKLKRRQRPKPGIEGLTRQIGLDSRHGPLPDVSGDHRVDHRSIPMSALPLHLLSTYISTMRRGRNVHEGATLRPEFFGRRINPLTIF